jgi:hypothetical protein
VDAASDDRPMISFNPEQTLRPTAIRERRVAQHEEAIAGTDKLKATGRAHLAGSCPPSSG